MNITQFILFSIARRVFSSFWCTSILFISFLDNHDNAHLKDWFRTEQYFIKNFRFWVKEVAQMLNSLLSSTLLRKIETSSFNNHWSCFLKGLNANRSRRTRQETSIYLKWSLNISLCSVCISCFVLLLQIFRRICCAVCFISCLNSFKCAFLIDRSWFNVNISVM